MYCTSVLSAPSKGVSVNKVVSVILLLAWVVEFLLAVLSFSFPAIINVQVSLQVDVYTTYSHDIRISDTLRNPTVPFRASYTTHSY